MTEKDRVEFSNIITALGTTFDKAITDPLLDIYFSALDELTFEEFKRAANEIIHTARFFPKPVDFLEAAHGSAEDRAQQAWNVLCEAVDKIGWPKSLFVLDPRMAYAIEQTFGGWIEVNEVLSPLGPGDPMFASLRKTFCQNYRLNREAAQKPRYFPSLCEANNRQNVAQWQDRPWPMLEDGTPVYQQHIGIITPEGKIIETEKQFSALTGALSDGSRRELLGMADRKQLTETAQ